MTLSQQTFQFVLVFFDPLSVPRMFIWSDLTVLLTCSHINTVLLEVLFYVRLKLLLVCLRLPESFVGLSLKQHCQNRWARLQCLTLLCVLCHIQFVFLPFRVEAWTALMFGPPSAKGRSLLVVRSFTTSTLCTNLWSKRRFWSSDKSRSQQSKPPKNLRRPATQQNRNLNQSFHQNCSISLNLNPNPNPTRCTRPRSPTDHIQSPKVPAVARQWQQHPPRNLTPSPGRPYLRSRTRQGQDLLTQSPRYCSN